MMLLQELPGGPQGDIAGRGVGVAVDPCGDAWESLRSNSNKV